MKTYIIAELGINHNGDLKIVKSLIDSAKFAGVDAIKLQKRNIEKVYTKEYLDSYRESPFGSTNKEQKEGLELNKEAYDFIDDYCTEKGLKWLASAWDLESLEFLQQYNCPQNKIASAMLGHKGFVRTIAKKKKTTIISTGMSTLQEIDEVVGIFRQEKCNFILMHCNSQYPMPDKFANLKCIEMLKQRYNCQVGYSGHSPGIIDAPIAVALGASVIEKHITLDRAMYGSDQSSSIEPMGFYRMVQYIQCVEDMLGTGQKIITPGEEKVRAKLRRIKDY